MLNDWFFLSEWLIHQNTAYQTKSLACLKVAGIEAVVLHASYTAFQKAVHLLNLELSYIFNQYFNPPHQPHPNVSHLVLLFFSSFSVQGLSQWLQHLCWFYEGIGFLLSVNKLNV